MAGGSSPSTRAKKKKEDMITYIKDSYNELLNKVSWPKMDDLLKSTVVVIIASALFGLIVLALDQTSLVIMNELIYSIFG